MTEFKTGLEGVIAAETILSHVDGEAGRLVVRGKDIETWADTTGFDTFAPQIWDGLIEGPQLPGDMSATFGGARVALFPGIEKALAEQPDLTPIERVRAIIAGLPDTHKLAPHILLVAAMSVSVPAVIRMENGDTPVAPDASLGTADDFLRMATGKSPSEEERSALDAYLVTVADHGMNASTFAARVVASTEAGIISSVVAGLCALKGPLHGGAPGPVLDLLDELQTSDDIGGYILAELEAGHRMMGFGHRIYRVRDPRAEVLKKFVRRLPKTNGRLAFAEKLETEILDQLRAWKPDRPLETNVEYYTALLLEALGFPRSSFTCVFGLGRTLGWIAHATEQEQTGRLMRPRAVYVGPAAKAA